MALKRFISQPVFWPGVACSDLHRLLWQTETDLPYVQRPRFPTCLGTRCITRDGTHYRTHPGERARAVHLMLTESHPCANTLSPSRQQIAGPLFGLRAVISVFQSEKVYEMLGWAGLWLFDEVVVLFLAATSIGGCVVIQVIPFVFELDETGLAVGGLFQGHVRR